MAGRMQEQTGEGGRFMRRIWVLVGVIGFVAAAGAQSFDCRLAKTPVEKAICGSAELSKQDSSLAAQYKLEMGEIPADAQAELRQFQRSWLRGLPAVCQANAKQLSLTECLLREYKGQMEQLKARVPTLGGMTFVTRSIELKAKDAPDDSFAKQPELETNPGYGTLTATWPEALSTDPAWVAWNAAMVRETQRMSDSGEVKAKTPGWKQAWALGTEATVTARVSLVTPQLVSTGVTNEFMGHGAAHPGEVYETFHWMLKEQRPLKVADVFKPGWEAVVTARCKASLKKQLGDDYQSYAGAGQPGEFAKTLHGVVSDPGNWEFGPAGLTLSFPEYSVTARAEPADSVTVPWAALQGFLVEGFGVPGRQ